MTGKPINNKNMKKEKVRELIPLMQAYADGKTIQFYNNETKRWVDVAEPDFRVSLQYRVKPVGTWRPFRDADECWNEMLNHKPFGWLTYNDRSPLRTKVPVTRFNDNYAMIDGTQYYFNHDGHSSKGTVDALIEFSFTDGTPFGLREQEQL